MSKNTACESLNCVGELCYLGDMNGAKNGTETCST